MSQLLARIAKKLPSTKKHELCFRSLSTAATPYLLFNPSNKHEMTLSCEPLVELNLYDPRKDETVKVPDQTLTKDLLRSSKVGSSRGWVVARDFWYKTFHLTNMYNPGASPSSRKTISLPPTREEDFRISLSASPDQEDCVLAAMPHASAIIMCRPGDSEWTPVKLPFYASDMIYSERDGKFYLNRRDHDKEYNGPVDLIDTSSSGFPQVSLFQRFPSYDVPKSRLEDLSSIYTKEHIVESPSGEIFIVYWLKNKRTTEEPCAKEPPSQSSLKDKPKGFVVFRQDFEQRVSSYTQDIGDLCIFLGGNEAFCVSSTEYPGLKPNTIYFTDYSSGFGFYDLSSNTVHAAINPPPFSCCYHWLAPLQ